MKQGIQKSPREMLAQEYVQSSLRFPIQAELKKQFMGVPTTRELLKADIKIQSSFNKLVTSFHATCRGVNLGQQSMSVRAQDGIITRI